MSEKRRLINHPFAMFRQLPDLPFALPPDRPVLIAGATASGKSELALRIAEAQGGVIINADAIQVFANWRILTARPDDDDLARAPHALYGHMPGDADYSVGAWLRDVAPFLASDARPIIVGGTGLYFAALTVGLADIPPIPPEIRPRAEARLATHGLSALVDDLDAATRARIDLKNPMRVQRAWEVLQATGRGLADWQAQTEPGLLPLDQSLPILLNGSRDWLNPRIESRFRRMIDQGALDEARDNLATWSPAAPSSKAIGAAELIAHLRGEISLTEAITRATIATRQFAKRQRTWFRARMQNWHNVDPARLNM